MLKLFAQKETDAGRTEMFTGFLSPESGTAKETEAYDRYVKSKKSRELFLGQRHCIKEHASFHWSI